VTATLSRRTALQAVLSAAPSLALVATLPGQAQAEAMRSLAKIPVVLYQTASTSSTATRVRRAARYSCCCAVSGSVG
jgi:hypothetical protein